MVGLLSLAPELLHEIVWLVADSPPPSQSLTRYEVKVLRIMRRVCRFVNAIAEPILFRHLVMRIKFREPESPCHRQMQDLAEGKTAACTHARALTLRVDYNPFEGEPWIEDLALALDALRNVNSVTYVSGRTISMISLNPF
jgi:hypothetical protein